MRNYITEVLEPFFDFLTVLVNKFGTKFVIATIAIGALVAIAYYKILTNCPEWIFPAGIVAVAIAYFVFRSKQELAGTPPQDTTSTVTSSSVTKTP